MKKKILLAILVVILLLKISIITREKPIYGNDEESIIEAIASINLYEGRTIHIFEIYDFDNDRVVTFLSNSSPSIIEFDKNSKGDYEIYHSETRDNENLSQFFKVPIGHNDEVIIFSVKNHFSTTDKYSFKANEEIYTVNFNLGHSNSQWTKLSKSDDNSYRFEWFIPEN